MILHFSRRQGPEQIQQVNASSDPDTPKLRLLLIGDSRWGQHLLVTALDSAHPRVDTALDLKAGCLSASQITYDLVILALPIAGTNGATACHRLRADGVTCPIVVLDPCHDVAAIIESLEAGADAYLVEPIAAAELRARLAVLVRRYGRATPYGEQSLALPRLSHG